MKQELLEYLVRRCVREVLEQRVNEVGSKPMDDGGAEAPPGDGQGTADQPPVEKDKDTTPEDPSKPETPYASSLKGVLFINPRDKSKIKPITVTNDANLAKNLQSLAKTIAGPQGFVAHGTLEAVQKAISGQIPSIFLYFGKLASDARDIYLQADASMQVAKDNSVLPSEITGTPVPQTVPMGVSSQEPLTPPQAQTVNEQKLRLAVTKMINEVLTKK
jgi:hypothetical protein